MRQALRFPALAALIVLMTGTAARGQTAAASPSPAPGVTAPATAAQNSGDRNLTPPVFPETTPYPVDVDRVREHLEQLPAVRIDEQQIRFYALVVAKEQSFFEKFAKDYDFRNGPTRGGAPMTNQEFLNMVTPKELNELFGMTSGSSFAMLQAAVMNAGAQALIKKGLKQIHDARNDHEIQAIRAQINRELAALLGKDQQ
jgi:hypothetical protein